MMKYAIDEESGEAVVRSRPKRVSWTAEDDAKFIKLVEKYFKTVLQPWDCIAQELSAGERSAGACLEHYTTLWERGVRFSFKRNLEEERVEEREEDDVSSGSEKNSTMTGHHNLSLSTAPFRQQRQNQDNDVDETPQRRETHMYKQQEQEQWQLTLTLTELDIFYKQQRVEEEEEKEVRPIYTFEEWMNTM